MTVASRADRVPPVPDRAWSALGTSLGVRLVVEPVTGDGPAADSAAGRLAAGRGLHQLGSPNRLVGRAGDGRPEWPPGWTGSISHRAGVAVAAVAPAASMVAVGVDVERAGSLTAAEADLVLAPSERRLLDRRADRDVLATVLWSAKEAAFKAWSTALGGLPDVDPVDVEVTLEPELRVGARGALAARVAAVGPLDGGLLAGPSWVLTVLVHPPVASRPADDPRG